MNAAVRSYPAPWAFRVWSAGEALGPRRAMAWAVSWLTHLGIVALLAWTLSEPPPKGTTSERATGVGLAVRPAPIQNRALHGENSPESDSPSQAAPTNYESVAEAIQAAVASSANSSLAGFLPKATVGVTSEMLGARGAFHPGPASGSIQSRGQPGGKARVTLFGITGEGYKFVYIFDRSDSMNWFDRRPLRAAKAELLASLDGLGETHQFQIIFYNHEPLIFNPSGQAHRLAFGTEDNKLRAKRFVESVTASGGTRHMEAILLGLSLQPDVVFLLTDADDPQLTDTQVASIVRRAAGVTIHTIEFGYGPRSRPDNFLVRLAKLTGGQHVYVDVSRL